MNENETVEQQVNIQNAQNEGLIGPYPQQGNGGIAQVSSELKGNFELKEENQAIDESIINPERTQYISEDEHIQHFFDASAVINPDTSNQIFNNQSPENKSDFFAIETSENPIANNDDKQLSDHQINKEDIINQQLIEIEQEPEVEPEPPRELTPEEIEQLRIEEEERLEREKLIQEDQTRVEGIIKSSLSQISKTANNQGFAFIKIDLKEKELTSLYHFLYSYRHLRYINISDNKLTDIKWLISIPSLMAFDASKNEIEDISVFSDFEFSFLHDLNLSSNKIKFISKMIHPRLRRLNLNGNEIISMEGFEGPKSLELLEIRKNKLVSPKGISNLPNLTELYLAENEIVTIGGLTCLHKLERVSFRGNKIEEVTRNFELLYSLTHINLRDNQLSSLKSISNLKRLRPLRSLNLQGNPVGEELGGGLKKEIIILLPQLTKVNKEEVTKEDRQEIQDEIEQKRLEEEERLKQESGEGNENQEEDKENENEEE